MRRMCAEDSGVMHANLLACLLACLLMISFSTNSCGESCSSAAVWNFTYESTKVTMTYFLKTKDTLVVLYCTRTVLVFAMEILISYLPRIRMYVLLSGWATSWRAQRYGFLPPCFLRRSQTMHRSIVSELISAKVLYAKAKTTSPK